jgi:hypothetical protein
MKSNYSVFLNTDFSTTTHTTESVLTKQVLLRLRMMSQLASVSGFWFLRQGLICSPGSPSASQVHHHAQ